MVGFKEQNLEKIGAIARSIGWGAADVIQHYYDGTARKKLSVKQKKEGPVTLADLAANEYILTQLRIAFGSQEFGYISEEIHNELPLPYPGVWIIDPIDGTNSFINRTGRYSIHIALVAEGRPVVAVMVLPASGKLYYAQLGAGAFAETRAGEIKPLKVSERDRLPDLCLLLSPTRRNQRFTELSNRLPCQHQYYVGSIGYTIAAIVEQEADIYISLSGKSAPKDWDLAAPELILTEAGGQFTHLDGSPLMYNQKDVNQWGCLIGSNGHCHAELCTQVETILAELDSKT